MTYMSGLRKCVCGHYFVASNLQRGSVQYAHAWGVHHRRGRSQVGESENIPGHAYTIKEF